jgi:F-type H+-transporting ATPase subunit alpha
MKKVAGKLKLAMAQYRELAAFAQFGTAELDKATKSQIDRGQRITEVLKQPQYQPMTVPEQVTILYAVINGYLDDVAVAKVGSFESRFHQFMANQHAEIIEEIAKTKMLSDETEAKLKEAITEFKRAFGS